MPPAVLILIPGHFEKHLVLGKVEIAFIHGVVAHRDVESVGHLPGSVLDLDVEVGDRERAVFGMVFETLGRDYWQAKGLVEEVSWILLLVRFIVHQGKDVFLQ